jgi:hypothetical protein
VKKYLYPLAMLAAAMLGASGILGYAWCDKNGGCHLLTGNDLEAAGQQVFGMGAQIGYNVGLAGCKAKSI